MEKGSAHSMDVVVFKGAKNLRQKLVYATLTGKTLRVNGIRENAERPGLQAHEASLLRLIEKITNGSVVEISETGTSLRYAPGIVVGGANLNHDCGKARAIGYFLEPLVLLSMFGKKPLSITLKGITNDDIDPSVDCWRSVTLLLLREFGIGDDDLQKPLQLSVNKRGMRPAGGGEVFFHCPTVKKVRSVRMLDEGMVKRVRGIAYSANTPPHMTSRMVDGARGVLNKLLADVYIFTDHMSGVKAGHSPGYGVALIGETTTGSRVYMESSCSASTKEKAKERAGERVPGDFAGEMHTEHNQKQQLQLVPELVGENTAKLLLEEINRGGYVDGSHQALALSLCAMSSPDEISQLRMGPLTPHSVETLRLILEFFKVKFKIAPEQQSRTLFLSCIGAGITNNVKAMN